MGTNQDVRLAERVVPFLRPDERLLALAPASSLPAGLAVVLPVAMVVANRWRVIARTDQRLLVLDAGTLLVRPRAVLHELPADHAPPVLGRRRSVLRVAVLGEELWVRERDATVLAGVASAGAAAGAVVVAPPLVAPPPPASAPPPGAEPDAWWAGPG